MATNKYLLLMPVLLLLILPTSARGGSGSASAEGRHQTDDVARALPETAIVVSPAPATAKRRSAIDPSFDAADIDWRRFEGGTINVLLSGHPIQGTIIGRLDEFKKLTGITVIVDVMPEEDFFQKLDIDFESSKGAIDVFMTSPLYQWRYAQAGWIEDLRPYLADPVLTDKDWFNTDDFFPVLLKASMWDGSIGGGLGQGALYSIPAWWEGCTLMYRKDLAARYGFREPTSWDDLFRQVSRIPGLSSGKLYGFAGRGIRILGQDDADGGITRMAQLQLVRGRRPVPGR